AQNVDAGPIELRSAVCPDVAFVRTRFVPGHPVAEQRNRGRPLCPISKRRRHADVLRDLYSLRRQTGFASIHRDARLSSLQIHHVEWFGSAEQGHGAVSPKNQRPVRDAGPAGPPKHLRDVFGPFAFLEYFAARRRAGVPLGSYSDGKLRVADRNGSWLAGDQPRRRGDAPILHRRVSARFEEPGQSGWTSARAADPSERN